MSATAVPAPAGRTLVVAGRPYPVLLPSIRDPRLHLAAVIISLQVLGQVAFDFRLSIAQILISLGTCAVLEVGITAWRQQILMWPASALLTGNGVAFILRVPGTEHGEWWSLHGAWIFAATAAVSLLSKYAIRVRGEHVFNPSNIGLVACFLALGPTRAEPLDFWWGPMSAWMVLALAIIVVGGLAILGRLHLLPIAAGFWLAFAAALGAVAAAGHAMTARWRLDPLTGFDFWRILVTSPEVLVFLFFMITDPKTIPRGERARVAYAVAIGLLAALLIAPASTEYWSKVAVLGALAIVCLARALLAYAPRIRVPRLALVAAAFAGLALYGGALALAGLPARPEATAPPRPYTGPLPAITVLPSRGVHTTLARNDAAAIVRQLMADLQRHRGRAAASRARRVEIWLEPGMGQDAPSPVVRLEGVRSGAADPFDETFELKQVHGIYRIGRVRR